IADSLSLDLDSDEVLPASVKAIRAATAMTGRSYIPQPPSTTNPFEKFESKGVLPSGSEGGLFGYKELRYPERVFPAAAKEAIKHAQRIVDSVCAAGAGMGDPAQLRQTALKKTLAHPAILRDLSV
ncbi:hypothetical protein HK405_008389, partial [Cladochytrium tenue]